MKEAAISLSDSSPSLPSFRCMAGTAKATRRSARCHIGTLAKPFPLAEGLGADAHEPEMPSMTDTDSIALAVAAFLFVFVLIALAAWAFKTLVMTGG